MAARELSASSLESKSAPPPPISCEEVQSRGALNELSALHRSMSVHIMRLDSQLETVEAEDLRRLLAWYLRKSIILRDLLVQAAGWPDRNSQSVKILTGATVSIYRWAHIELEELCRALSEGASMSPKAVPWALTVFHDLSQRCSAVGSASGRQMAKTLLDIDVVLYHLIVIRGRLVRAMAAQCL